MDTTNLPSREVEIGKVYTPLEWACWIIKKWGLFDQWIRGFTICDPTAGEGIFALALYKFAADRKEEVTENMANNLYLYEISGKSLENFQAQFVSAYGDKYPRPNSVVVDIILDTPNAKYDVIFGNPPWSNFSNLPSEYKELIKNCYVDQGLVPDKKKSLLGSSRVDIASLVTKIAVGKLLKEDGSAYLYLPTSLFKGDNAHKGFRDYKASGIDFSVECIYEFKSSTVFADVGTEYCCAQFCANKKQSFPINYFKEDASGCWQHFHAKPIREPDSQYLIQTPEQAREVYEIPTIYLRENQKPRQGANTCGSNGIFIFDRYPSFLPEKYIFPLATKECWKVTSKDYPKTASKWILMPYDENTGKPLPEIQLKGESSLHNYLTGFRELLEERKGTMLRASFKRGLWYALLGVGKYSFSPFKVMWEAYGKKDFDPIILGNIDGRPWQGNQAMHAYIPATTLDEAKHIKNQLKNPDVEEYLKLMNGSGKCNWAQPGKIKNLISCKDGSNLSEQLSFLVGEINLNAS